MYSVTEEVDILKKENVRRIMNVWSMDDSIMNEIVYTNWINAFDGVYGCEI